jgi:D-methionine transport system permease protein
MSSAIALLLLDGLEKTAAMVGISGAIGTLLGIPLGVLLTISAPGHIRPRPSLHRVLGIVVNLTRSTPFIILMVAIIPFTRLVVGTSVGTAAAIVPLSVAITPLLARLVEVALREVDHGLIEAAQAGGLSIIQVVVKVLLPEALPGIIAGLTTALVSLIGYSTMAGTVGGGGLGDLGVRFGYQRFRPDVMLAVVVMLVVVVEGVQLLGDWLARRVNHRQRSAG